MSEVVTPTDGGQGAAPAAAPVAAAPAAAPAAPASPAWLPNADEITVGYLQNKGWTEPAQVLDGYRNLEKLLGADKAGNAVVIPKADADPAEWGKVYDRLGRPSDAAGYKLPVPEGADPTFAKTAASKFHELGLSSKQGEALTAWWNEQAAGVQTAQQQAAQQRFADDDRALKTDWGNAYTQNLNQAQAAVRGLGLEAAQIDALSASLGHKATMELFQKIGSRMGEGEYVDGGKPTSFGSALTPAQAKAEIQSLRSDKTFVAKLLSKDVEATKRWTELHNYAHPQTQES